MKKIILLFLLLLLTINTLLSQTEFMKGYYITEQGDRIEGLIKNDDWKNNPTSFSFKKNDTDSPSNKSISNVILFEIYNISKFEKKLVLIDKASSRTNQLSKVRQPEFVEEELFLKVLVEGDASLYFYEDTNLIRYFFKTSKEDVSQLIYKKYLTNNNSIAENVTYQYQLKTSLNCNNNTLTKTESLKYTTKDLINFFNSYNQCVDPNFQIIDTTPKKKSDRFNLSVRPGIRLVSFESENPISNQRSISKNSGIGFRLGIELESILPFNNNKWGLVLEPTYQTYNTTNTEDDRETGVNYNALEFALGGRHYLFLNDKTKLFINAGYNFNISLGDSYVQFTETTQIESNNTGNLTIGAGLKWNDTFSGELRFHTSRDLQSDVINTNTDYNVIEFVIGYTIF